MVDCHPLCPSMLAESCALWIAVPGGAVKIQAAESPGPVVKWPKL